MSRYCHVHDSPEVGNSPGVCTEWVTDPDIPTTPLCSFDVVDERKTSSNCPTCGRQFDGGDQ